MMKKMLVLALVLAVAGLANAGLQFKVDGANVANGYVGVGSTLEIQMDYTGVDYYVAIVGDKGFALVGNPSVMPDASGEVLPSCIIDGVALPGLPAGFDGPIWTIANYSTGVTKPMATFFTVTAGQKPVTIQVMDCDGSAITGLQGAVTLIPEPMTMGLLALGALFLRKK